MLYYGQVKVFDHIESPCSRQRSVRVIKTEKTAMLLNLLKKILQNKILWYMASRYMVLAIQFLASIFLAVKLGAYYFGIWSFVVLLASIGSNCNWGIGNAATIMLV